MTQCNRTGAVRAWSVALVLLLGTAGLASCGGSSSSKTTGATTNASAAATTPSSTSSAPGTSAPNSNGSGGATAPGTGSTTQGNGAGNSGGTKAGAAPIVRASSFVACMRAHGIKLPAATRAGGGATLDFKGVNTHGAQYKNAIAACARELLGTLSANLRKGASIKLKGIQVKGIDLKAIHIGHIELPKIHVNVPTIHVTTPAPNLGGSSSGAPPTEPNQGATG